MHISASDYIGFNELINRQLSVFSYSSLMTTSDIRFESLFLLLSFPLLLLMRTSAFVLERERIRHVSVRPSYVVVH